MSRWLFELEQDGRVVASGEGPREDMLREAQHYTMIYGQDGPVQAVVWRHGDERPPTGPTYQERNETIGNHLSRIAAIDEMFADATGWGSWMVSCANEREALVNLLGEYYGVVVDHKHLARTPGGSKVD